MKIAIWGYGKYGRRMFDSLTRLCPKEYEVVLVYDKNYEKLKFTDEKCHLPIHNPEEISEDYKNGFFEKILLCIFGDVASREPKRFLKINGIPELHLGKREDFCSLSFFEQGKKPFEIERENYDFYVVKKLYGAMANYESDEILYLFNDEGRVVKEHTDRFDYALENAFLFDYPFVFRHSKAERIILKGQYCILTKKHSGNNYWHFTYNCLDVVWLLEQAGFQGKYVVPNAKFCSEILNMLDVPLERIVTLSTFEHNKIYIFEEVFYIVSTGTYLKYSPSVLLEAVEYIKKKLPVDSSLPKMIYIKRIGRRKLIAADKIIAGYGFITVIPEKYSVREQMALFFNADIVLSVHGANSTNCMYMRKNTVFIEAFSSYWINRCNLYTIAEAGVHYLPVSPLETVYKNNDGILKDFKIPEVLLRMTIENAILIYQAQHRFEPIELQK